MNYISNVLGNMLDAGIRLCKKKSTLKLQTENTNILNQEDLVQTSESGSKSDEEKQKRLKIEWVSPQFSPINNDNSEINDENCDPNIQNSQNYENKSIGMSQGKFFKLKQNIKSIKEFLNHSPKFYLSKEHLIEFTRTLKQRAETKSKNYKNLKEIILENGMKLVEYRSILFNDIKTLIYILEYNHVTLHYALNLADLLISKKCFSNSELPFLPYFCIQTASKLFQIQRFSYEFLLDVLQKDVTSDKIRLEELLKFEGKMLKIINFDLNLNLGCNVIDIFSLLLNFEIVEFILCHFICELAVENYKISCQIDQFYIGIGCVLLVLNPENPRYSDTINLLEKEFDMKKTFLEKLRKFMKEKYWKNSP